MSLIGAVSLTNQDNGLYLGKVSIDNLNVSSNQILYSTDGVNITGLNPSTGLDVLESSLVTVGNPEIQLTSNSLYVNDNYSTIQSKVNEVSQADVIYISSGSYGETVTISDKYNIALQAPAAASTICEILSGVIINGTSELIRLSNLQIKGIESKINGVGRQKLENIVFTGSSSQTHTIQFGKDSTKFITVLNSEFDNYCNLSVSNTFASVIYFINCNFGGCAFNLAQSSNLQVIFNNCAGFTAFPAKATYVGMNVLTSGVSNLSTTNINGSAYPPASGVSVSNQSTTRIPYETAVNNSLNSNSNLTFNDLSNTLAVPNITVTNINGSAPVSVTAQANNRLITATATTNTLHSNQDLTWDGIQLQLFNNSNNLSIGRGNNASSAVTNTAIGYQALNTITTGTGNTAIGYQALNNITTQSQNTFIGQNNTSSTGTIGSVCVGNTNICSSDNCVAIGVNARAPNASTIAIGGDCGKASSSTYNISIGRACFNNSSGSGSFGNTFIGNNCARGAISGYTNVGIGSYNVLNALTSGNGNVAIGANTAQYITTQINNTVIGANAMSSSAQLYSNCSCIGYNSAVTASNQVQLGDSSTTTYAYGAVQDRSDARDKADIQETDLGLAFIDKLKPVKFKWNYREDYEGDNDGSKIRNRYHQGLLAQDVKDVMDNLNIDFGGYQDHSINGGGDRLTLGYNEFIAPMIKAIQELSDQNRQMMNRIKVLESLL